MLCKRCGEEIGILCSYCVNFFLQGLRAENMRLEAENNKMKELINDLYPAIAGLVIAAQKTGEKNAEKIWNEYCKRMIEFQEEAEV